MAARLLNICFAQRDDTQTRIRRNETQHMQPTVEIAERHIARLAVFLAPVDRDRCGFEIEIDRPIEGQTARRSIARTFVGIEFI